MTVLAHVRHLGAQLPGLLSLGGTLAGLRRPAETIVAPVDRTLVRDYITHVGGDPDRYKATVPPHLFPQWGLALAARTLDGTGYPLHRAVNAGCRLEVNAPLPAGEPLFARAELESIVDDGRRVTLAQKVTTGTRDVPDAVVATIHAIIPLARSTGARRRTIIPYGADELARWRLAKDAGLAFALLTGDFNPIHWSSRAGRAAGFGGPILHGFAIFARAVEGLVRGRYAGDLARVHAWDARFTRPLRLPSDVALYARGREAWIGETPGVAAVMTMTVEEHA
jgi:acyl dehydratase